MGCPHGVGLVLNTNLGGGYGVPREGVRRGQALTWRQTRVGDCSRKVLRLEENAVCVRAHVRMLGARGSAEAVGMPWAEDRWGPSSRVLRLAGQAWAGRGPTRRLLGRRLA